MLTGVLNESPSKMLLQDLDGSTKVLRETSERFVRMIAAPPMQIMTKFFWESQKSQVANAILPARITGILTYTQMIVRRLVLPTEYSLLSLMMHSSSKKTLRVS